MVTNKVKCPECGVVKKVQGSKTFVCCGSKWSIEENLVVPRGEESFEEEMDNAEEEVDLNEEKRDKLPVRRKKRVVKDDLICPFCAGDLYGTQRRGVYYCDRCERYLIEE